MLGIKYNLLALDWPWGGAYYARPVYLGAVLIWIIVVVFYVFHERKRILLLSLGGLLLVAFPQFLINCRNFSSYSPFILTNESQGVSLYLKQLSWGIVMQKYETNLDVNASIPMRMVYDDMIGNNLLKGAEFSSYFEYIKFCIRHLADVLCIYLKHIFNGLDIVYPDIYIKKVYSNRFFTQFINYSLIFIGGSGIGYFVKRNFFTKRNICIFGVYSLPVILVIPTAIEPRFFVGVHGVLFLFAVCCLTNKKWLRLQWTNKWIASGKYLLFICICFLLNSLVFNSYGISLW